MWWLFGLTVFLLWLTLVVSFLHALSQHRED